MTKRFKKIVKWNDDFDYKDAWVGILFWAIIPAIISLFVENNWMVAWIVFVSGVTIVIFIIQKLIGRETLYEEIK